MSNISGQLINAYKRATGALTSGTCKPILDDVLHPAWEQKNWNKMGFSGLANKMIVLEP